MKPMFSVVIPVFNEEESISEFYRRLSAMARAAGNTWEFIFINVVNKVNH